MAELTPAERQHIIELLESGENLDSSYKDILFPPDHEECKLEYAGKKRDEDILAETMAVPLQPIRTFGDTNSDWHNMLIFGDNLQAMKTLLKQKKEHKFINSDGFSGIQLVYIDPPFGTGDEYGRDNEEMAYSARVQGAKFISFLQKRLVFIRELLSPSGTVFVRLDHHFGHYMKVMMDEVFKEFNFRNEIVINRIQKKNRNLKRFNVSTESLYFYSKSSDYYFVNLDAPRVCNFCGTPKEPKWEDMTSPGLRNPPQRIIYGQEYLPRTGRHFMYTQENIDGLERESRLRINDEITYNDLLGRRIKGRPEYLQTETVVIDNNWTDIKGYAYANNYPTENHEDLLERVIRTGSRSGDVVLDAFAGSGTTLAVAEKLGRRWIGIDCGKVSMYTIQRRMLNLRTGIGNKGKVLKHKPYTLYNAGLYDFSQLRKLPWEGWRFFALTLFECRDEPHNVGGIKMDGYRSGYDVVVFNHTLNGGVVLDYGYIEDLHTQIGSKLGSRVFIIAPAASIAFIEDYVEEGGTRYYILRIPYSIINELHNVNFEPIAQSEDVMHVNEIVEAVGFDFIRPPIVECEYVIQPRHNSTHREAVVKLKAFKSNAIVKGENEKKGMEALSMVLVDYDHPHYTTRQQKEATPPFELDIVFYANQIKNWNWEIRMPVESLGENLMLIFVDIYGNEYVEVKSFTDFETTHLQIGGKDNISQSVVLSVTED